MQNEFEKNRRKVVIVEGKRDYTEINISQCADAVAEAVLVMEVKELELVGIEADPVVAVDVAETVIEVVEDATLGDPLNMVLVTVLTPVLDVDNVPEAVLKAVLEDAEGKVVMELVDPEDTELILVTVDELEVDNAVLDMAIFVVAIVPEVKEVEF